MKVKVTIKGAVELGAGDVTKLKGASVDETMQTLLAIGEGMSVLIERPQPKKKVKVVKPPEEKAPEEEVSEEV